MAKQRLTVEQREIRNEAIRRAYHVSKTSASELAKAYKLAVQTIHLIVQEKPKPVPYPIMERLGEDYTKWKLRQTR